MRSDTPVADGGMLVTTQKPDKTAFGMNGRSKSSFDAPVWMRFRTAMNEMLEASRVPSGHGFPATIKNPQPDGMRLANLSS